MYKYLHRIYRIILPLGIIFVGFFLFYSNTSGVTYNGYTYETKFLEKKLSLISGKNSIDSIFIDEKAVIINESMYQYYVTSLQGVYCNIDFLLPSGESFSANNFNLSIVSFHNVDKEVSHGGNQKMDMNVFEQEKDLLISTAIVYVRFTKLVDDMKKFLVVYVILLVISLIVYWSSDKNLQKLFFIKHNNERSKIIFIRMLTLSVIIVSSLIPLIFI
ncbi:MAG: hypothetical protein R3Y47_12165 [Lachnospiraceae bacterium]